MDKTVIGSEITTVGAGSEWHLMGIDLQEKKYGIPVWGWGIGLGYLAYRLLFKKR